MKKFFLILFFSSLSVFAREKGQTEITTEEGIEVFQKEKFYLLKKNVSIESDNFILSADLVKAFFEKDLYDIQNIESEGNVKFTSSDGVKVEGEILNFSIKNNLMEIFGKNSSLNMNNLNMQSDKLIQIDDQKGVFIINGKNSKLKTENLTILGNYIEGSYQKINEQNEIISLNVKDKEIAEIWTDKLKMYALKAIYSKEDNLIELFDEVKVIRDNEIIVGDYAKINMVNESYKVTSKKSGKVKVLIDNNE